MRKQIASPKVQKKLRALLMNKGKEFCACASMYNLECKGSCREAHTKNGETVCGEVYTIDVKTLLQQLKRSERLNETLKSINKEEKKEKSHGFDD